MQHRRGTTCPTQVDEVPKRKIVPKPLFFEVFHVLLPLAKLECAVKTRDAKHEKKRKFFRAAKNAKNDLQNGIFLKHKNPKKPKTAEENRFPETAKKHFLKQWFQKPGAAKRRFGGRILTHETRKRGPQTNAGAYIYIYIYIQMLSRQLGDHVFAFSQVNVWDAFAPRTHAIFQVTPFPPRVSSQFFKIQNTEARTTPKVNE